LDPWFLIIETPREAKAVQYTFLLKKKNKAETE
jgi:hypothetical protein